MHPPIPSSRRRPSPPHWALAGATAALALGLLASTACKDPDDTDPDDTGAPTADIFEDVQVEVSETIPTVATLRWHTTAPATCRVTFGEVDGTSATTSTEAEAGTEHEAVLVGVPQEREIQFAITAETATGSVTSEPGSYTTGQLEEGLVEIDVLVEATPESAGGFTLVPMFRTGSDVTEVGGKVVLLDTAGEYLWATDAGFVPRARLAPDGSGVLFLSQEGEEDGTTRLRETSWTGEVTWDQEILTGQRDFVILDDDTVAMLIQDNRELDEHGAIVGDALVIATRDGSQEITWSIFDALGPDWCAGDHEVTQDWSHANYLTWLPDPGLVLVVLRSFPAIVAIDPYTGEQAWILSNECSDFESSDGEPQLNNPHSVELTEDGLLIFNQGDEPDGCSGMVEVSFDPAEPSVTPLWSWADPDCMHTYFMGNAYPLPNGNRMSSLLGMETEVTPNGTVVHELSASLGGGFGYVERVMGLYP